MVDFVNEGFLEGECYVVAMYIKENRKIQYHWKRRYREWKAKQKVTENFDIFGNNRSYERKIPVSPEKIDIENDELMDISAVSGIMR